MTSLGLSEARNNLPDAVNRVAYGGERIIMQRRGRNVAALVSMEDLALLEELEDRADAAAVAASWAEQGSDPPEDWEAVKTRMGWR